jgi:hypothetical protein
MWLRVGLIVGRVLLRLLIRLTPILVVGLAAVLRRYRWPIYYRAMALRPSRETLSAVPVVLLSSAGGLVLLAVGLYLLVNYLAPHP